MKARRRSLLVLIFAVMLVLFTSDIGKLPNFSAERGLLADADAAVSDADLHGDSHPWRAATRGTGTHGSWESAFGAAWR